MHGQNHIKSGYLVSFKCPRWSRCML